MGYNHIMTLGYWIEDMRDDALEPKDLNDRNIVVVNVGGGTNFTTLGMMEPFKECNIIKGDVNLPFPTNYVNRCRSHMAKSHARVLGRMSHTAETHDRVSAWVKMPGYSIP
ncbi:hypothetical protein Golob_012083 [Gossypium lobatum]|uniref:Uncharacterized protein n=1 Tax=Gossypium lobatum TaxID=34289 RepID=A0A7J8MRZ6_9ROSI|nr:hypothetical protein [Gossypium lobatum]